MDRGTRWREIATGRIAVVLGPGPNSPWMRWEDESNGNPWYCCIEDFSIWRRFEEVV